MPYWMHALLWSFAGVMVWGSLAIVVVSLLGVSDAARERREIEARVRDFMEERDV